MKLLFLVFIFFSFLSFGQEKGLVAKVNGVGITENELLSQVNWLKNQLMLMGRDPKQVPEEQIKEQALQSLIEMELAFQDAKDKKFSAKKEEVEEKFAEFKKRFKEEKDYKDYLDREKTTEKDLKKDIEKEIVINKYIEGNIYKDMKPVSEEEIKKFFDENPSYFVKPEQVKASHILISVPENATEEQKKEAKKKAEGILKDLKKGANFEEVAKEKSDCPSKKNGGDLGFFPKGRMVKPFEDAAFSLKPGVLSDLVETQFGYHIILVKEHKQEEKMKFEEVKDRIKSFLEDSKKRELIQKRISELTQKAKIEKYIKTEEKSHNHTH